MDFTSLLVGCRLWNPLYELSGADRVAQVDIGACGVSIHN